MFEGYLDWSAEANRKGRDASRALCICHIGKFGRLIMTLCPVALAVGCIKCPVFKICPAKGIIGDYKKDAPPPADLKRKQ
jgi:hypothetical protein